jgi:deazaflavin-dependent oxidoreductase (nitroreductase family)
MPIAIPRPGKWVGSLLKLPVFLYHHNLGRLLGHRFLLVAHRGRKSGKIYETVLEVIDYDARRRESYVLSAWGQRSDWYRNIQASPAIMIQTGGRRYTPVQRSLTPEEGDALWATFMQEHPVEERLASKLLSVSGNGKNDNPGPGESRRIVAFRPRIHPRKTSKEA